MTAIYLIRTLLLTAVALVVSQMEVAFALSSTAVSPCPVLQVSPAPSASLYGPRSAETPRSPQYENPAEGLYLFEDHVDLANWREMYRAGIESQWMAGAAIMLNWKSIEPAPHQFCWEALDLELGDVLRLGKTFTIGLVAGGQAPTWLYDTAGVPALRDIPFNPTLSKTGAGCQKLNQPLVWDDRYLHQYGEAMVALAAHLRGISLPILAGGTNPAKRYPFNLPDVDPPSGTALDALAAVKLSGINVGTEELRLDQHPKSDVCGEPDVTAMWKARGYRPQLVFAAWVKIAQMTATAYPGKLLNVDLIPNGAFPNIDEQGNITPAPNRPGVKHVVEPMNAAILKYAVPKYQRGLMVQWDALSQDGIVPQEVVDSGRQGAREGYQMNGFGGGNFGGSGCIYNPGFVIGQCRTLDDYTKALLDGVHSGAQYIEVQPQNVAVQFLNPPNPNISTFDPAFQKAHEALRAHY